MKKNLFFLLCLSIFSCNSPRKLYSSGDDLQVINRVLAKEVKRKAKQEDIQYLERAFASYQSNRLQKILNAQKGSGEKKWAMIAHEASTLIHLQKHIQKQMPIQAKSGYKAKIKFEDVSEIYSSSVLKASAYHKKKGEILLASAISEENVYDARKAYEHLIHAKKYDETLDLNEEIEQARQLGIIRIFTSIRFPFWRSYTYDGLSKSEAERYLIKLLERPRSSTWVHFIKPNSRNSMDKNVDYELVLSMIDFDISNRYPSKETKSYSKQIEEVAKDKDGKPILDKEGKVIKTYRNVEATVEVEQVTHNGELKLEFKVIRLKDKNPIYSEYLLEEGGSQIKSCRIIGDRRALPSDISCKTRSTNLSEEALFRKLVTDLGYDFDTALKRVMKDF